MTQHRPAFAGRRTISLTRRSYFERRPVTAVPRQAKLEVAGRKTAPSRLASANAVTRGGAAAGRRTARSRVLRREGTLRPLIRTRRHRSVKGVLFGVLAVGLFLFGLAVGIGGLRTNHAVTAQVKQITHAAVAGATTTTTTSSDIPKEDNPPTPTTYHVAPDMPRILTISKIGVQARILRTTVGAHNELGVPASIFDSAWYDGSAKPGEAGAMLIDGHVSGPTQNGIFYNLKKLVKGDKITVERGDGHVFTYTVQASKTYDVDAVDMAAALTPVVNGRPGLNIMTCTGKLDSTRTHFQQRLVVFASQD